MRLKKRKKFQMERQLRHKMFDIIFFNLKNPEKFGFKKTYFFDSAQIKNKIIFAKSLSEAQKFKSQKKLIVIEDFEIKEEGLISDIIANKKVCFLIDLSKLIKSYGKRRAFLLSKTRQFIFHLIKKGAYFAVATFSKEEKDLRTSNEIENIMGLFNLNKKQILNAQEILGLYLEAS